MKEISAEKEKSSDDLELLLPPSLAHYDDLRGVWIANNHLEKVGLRKGLLAIVAREKIKRGDLVAITELENNLVSCGYYDADFGVVCLESGTSEVRLFDEKDVEIFGKIIGVCQSEKNPDGKMIVEPLTL